MNLGRIFGAFCFSLLQILALLVSFPGMQAFAESFAAIGPITLVLYCMASWPLLGFILGWRNEVFDDDHIQI